MNNTVYDIDFTRSLPPSLKSDTKMLALGKIIAGELQKNIRLAKHTIVYARIDELSENLLDVLAHDLHVDWYDDSLSVDVKRATIKNSVRVHKRLGTKYAVETALNAIYPDTAVKEWFEYGGDPYTFRIQIKAAADAEKQAQVLEQIRFYKNLRSHLDEIVYRIPIEGEARYYCGVRSIYKYKKIIAGVSHFNN